MKNVDKKRIRVLHVAEPSIAGVPRYIQMLLKYIDHEQFENILVGSLDYKESDWTDLADKLERIDMRHEIGKADIPAVFTVRALIKKYQPDIVYAHSSKAGVIARVANIGMKKDGEKICCIYNPHGWSFNMRCGKNKQMMYEIIERMASPFCNKIICISESEKKSALDGKICKEDKLQVILNGVDVEAYEQRKINGMNTVTRESCGIPEDAFVVGMVGRISEQKAPDVFIKVAKQFKNHIPNSHFIIVGEGPDRKKIEEYARENSIPLFITGWVDNASDYIELFDIALLLSRWEGFGLVIPEYMLAEKPVVATRVDAIPEIIKDGENGILVEADDAEKAAEAVLRIYGDNALRMRLINKGSISVHEKYNARRVCRETEELIKSMM